MSPDSAAPAGGTPIRVALIVATDLDGVIGRDNQLPWHLPADLRRFKRITMGKPMIMGRKTYESIGKPLPGRTSVVLSRKPGFVAPGCLVAHTPEEALDLASLALAASRAAHGVAPAGARPASLPDEIMVIGGEAVFRIFLPVATRLYWTEVQAHVPGDARLAGLEPGEWREVECTEQPAGPGEPFALRFRVLERVGAPGALRTGA